MKRRMQAKDVDDLLFLWLVSSIRGRNRIPTMYERSFDGCTSIPEFLGPTVPRKVLLVKATALIRRGLIDGCGCGCIGGFTLTDAGKDALAHRVVPASARPDGAIVSPSAKTPSARRAPAEVESPKRGNGETPAPGQRETPIGETPDLVLRMPIENFLPRIARSRPDDLCIVPNCGSYRVDGTQFCAPHDPTYERRHYYPDPHQKRHEPEEPSGWTSVWLDLLLFFVVTLLVAGGLYSLILHGESMTLGVAVHASTRG